MNSERPQNRASATTTDFRAALSSHLGDDPKSIHRVVARIQKWTGGQSALTSILCDQVLQFADQLEVRREAAAVDRVVDLKLIQDWENNAAAAELKKVSSAILEYEMRDTILILYIQILQRGRVSANNSPEQAALLRSGLVVLEDGDLKVANPLYKRVFDLAWVEKQLPGITRPVAIVQRSPQDKISRGAKLYSTLAALAFGIAVVVVAASTYLRQPGEISADSGTTSPVQSPTESLLSGSPGSPDSIPQTADLSNEAVSEGNLLYDNNQALFDAGMEHGRNGRWLPMLRQFCSLPKSSTYFAPAANQLALWGNLYPKDIETAKQTALHEKDGACPILQTSIEQESSKGSN